jgi:hypothetical protein
MSGRRAKTIRKSVYGPDRSPRVRQYRYARPLEKGQTHTTILAGALRALYQHAKRAWVLRTATSVRPLGSDTVSGPRP